MAGSRTVSTSSLIQCSFVVSCLVYQVVCLTPIMEEETLVWQSNDMGEFVYFRTPIVIRVPNGDLLSFSGAHKTTVSDIDAKGLATRRSKTGGLSWETTKLIFEDVIPILQGYFILGAALVDIETNVTMLLYSHCPHNICAPGVYPTTYIIRSYNSGYTWSKPEDLSIKNPAFANWTWSPGPGYGIQKRLGPAKGRLVVCGHTVSVKQSSELLCCSYSDDHGNSWQIGGCLVGIPYNVPKKTGDFMPDESQIVELPDGALLMNSRNQYHFHCSCRIISRSYDGGLSFPLLNVTVDETLIDPVCDGSVLIHDGIMFFSNPANSKKRENMTLRWSLNYGASWEGALTIFSGGSEYSTLTSIDDNHIGLIYEKNGYKDISFVRIRIH
ncbi:sialidase-1-like [Glandiceps talaboti]